MYPILSILAKSTALLRINLLLLSLLRWQRSAPFRFNFTLAFFVFYLYGWLTPGVGVLLHRILSFFIFFTRRLVEPELLRCPGMTRGHFANHPDGLTGVTSPCHTLPEVRAGTTRPYEPRLKVCENCCCSARALLGVCGEICHDFRVRRCRLGFA